MVPITWDLIPYGTGSFMMDLVTLAMFVVIPIQWWSIWLVRSKKAYTLHKRVQLITVGILLAAVALFEIDVRINGWRHLAEGSPYYDTWVFPVLYVHLFFSISTTLLLIITTIHGWRNFPGEPKPGPASKRHRFLGYLTAIDLTCTSVTGWAFYYLAFLA